MQHAGRADMAARVFLTLGVLAPYWRLLTFSVIFVTDASSPPISSTVSSPDG
jgi:hypothetical protein